MTAPLVGVGPKRPSLGITETRLMVYDSVKRGKPSLVKGRVNVYNINSTNYSGNEC
jgi:hypothetical protein